MEEGMDLRSRIDSDLKDAMRASDDLRKRTLRMVLASVKMADVEKGIKQDELAIIAIFQKEIKSRREAILDAEKANRIDLIQASRDEIKVLEAYLPQALSENELKTMAAELIKEMNGVSPADMGKVIKAMLAKLQGRAAGDQVSKIVRELLQK
jgi:uncharacterized protein YqeY